MRTSAPIKQLKEGRVSFDPGFGSRVPHSGGTVEGQVFLLNYPNPDTFHRHAGGRACFLGDSRGAMPQSTLTITEGG